MIAIIKMVTKVLIRHGVHLPIHLYMIMPGKVMLWVTCRHPCGSRARPTLMLQMMCETLIRSVHLSSFRFSAWELSSRNSHQAIVMAIADTWLSTWCEYMSTCTWMISLCQVMVYSSIMQPNCAQSQFYDQDVGCLWLTTIKSIWKSGT